MLEARKLQQWVDNDLKDYKIKFNYNNGITRVSVSYPKDGSQFDNTTLDAVCHSDINSKMQAIQYLVDSFEKH